MSKVTYDKLLCGPLSATRIHLLLADQTIHFPERLAKDILVKTLLGVRFRGFCGA